MKTQIPALMVLALITCSSAVVASEERESTAKEVPRPVHEAVHEIFQKTYPAATGLEYEEESVDGKITYEVEDRDG